MNNDDKLISVDEKYLKTERLLGESHVLVELMHLINESMSLDLSDEMFQKWQFAFQIVKEKHEEVLNKYRALHPEVEV